MRPRNQTKPPTAEDLAKAEQFARLRLQAATLEAPRPLSLGPKVANLEGLTRRTRDFLTGMPLPDKHPLQSLYLAATDLHGNGHAVEDVLPMLLSGAGAFDDPDRMDAALNSIARAYCKPRVSHREFMRDRERNRTRNNP